MFSKFSSVDSIYKINKNRSQFFYYFFNKTEKRNPLKDEVYELQKSMSNSLGQKFKEELLRYYSNNNFMDFTLTFIDGHVIAYFGKETFQKLKHSTRNEIMKALEVFNFSDKNGRIFYFRADHDVEGMRKNIEGLLNEVADIIGLDKITILVFDRGGFSGQLFKKLKKEYNLKFITLVTKNENINKQIKEIKKKVNFEKLIGDPKKRYAVSTLNVGGIDYRALLVLNTETNGINPFVTNMGEEELSNEALLQNYSMHWRQEQEHNAFTKIGGNRHSKVLQDLEFDDTTKIKQKTKLQNKIKKKDNEIIRLNLEARRLMGKKLCLTSKIKPKSKQTDNKLVRREISDVEKRLKGIDDKVKELFSEVEKAKTRLGKIPENPKKKKYKYGPVDYSISTFNLANNLNSRLVEICSNGEKKFQLKTALNFLYCVDAEVKEDENCLYINYISIRQDRLIKGFQRLCDYFNSKNVRLHGKIMKFSVIKAEKTPKIRSSKN